MSAYLSKIAIILIVQFTSNCHGFFKSNNKSVIDIAEGSDVSLLCPIIENSAEKLISCIITHNTKCRFEQKFENGIVSDQKNYCDEDNGRIVGTFNSINCGLHLKSILMEDTGKWTCDLEVDQNNNGLIKKVEGRVEPAYYIL